MTSHLFPRHFEVVSIRAVIRDALEELLSFLARYFRSYWDDQLQYRPYVPAPVDLLDKMDECRRYAAGLETSLSDILLEPLETYQRKCQFKQARYIEEFTQHLYPLILLPSRSTKSWILFLWRQNLNSFHFMQFLKRRIQGEINKLASPDEKRLRLLYYLKLSGQVHPHVAVSFIATMPGVQQQLSEFIKEELRYLKTTKDLIRTPVRKKKVNVSVSQLALLARACLESGLIESGKHELLREVAEAFCTQHKEEISLENLRNRYYSIDEGTRHSVRKLLRNMLKLIEPAKNT